MNTEQDLFGSDESPPRAPLPTRAAALSRIAAVRPREYARTRNHIDGAVTGLSPYITHGIVTLREVLAGVIARSELPVDHKFVYELGWREFFRHVWAFEGDGILQSLHAGALPDDHYSNEMPEDVRSASTGIPVIDESVRQLYTSGGLHNHARMWLSSYIVHQRRVHWRAGADWMIAHLLDGDLASNHLSWQWVAGTASHKPYLFNAENVARYAPDHWHSPATIVDKTYAELDAIARGAPLAAGIPWRGSNHDSRAEGVEPAVSHQPPHELSIQAPEPTASHDLAGREVWLVHPWILRAPPAGLAPNVIVIGVYSREFHQQWPWSTARWRWVDTAMRALTPRRWWASVDELRVALSTAARVSTVSDPHLDLVLPDFVHREKEPPLFPEVSRQCRSFSQWWTRTTRGLGRTADLL